jgi:hypothetical protein
MDWNGMDCDYSEAFFFMFCFLICICMALILGCGSLLHAIAAAL